MEAPRSEVTCWRSQAFEQLKQDGSPGIPVQYSPHKLCTIKRWLDEVILCEEKLVENLNEQPKKIIIKPWPNPLRECLQSRKKWQRVTKWEILCSHMKQHSIMCTVWIWLKNTCKKGWKKYITMVTSGRWDCAICPFLQVLYIFPGF